MKITLINHLGKKNGTQVEIKYILEIKYVLVNVPSFL